MYDVVVRSRLILAAFGLLVPARALAHDCIAESEAAQQERTDDHLRKARDLFKACSATDCPQSVRSDCERSFDEVDRATPTIVVIARSGTRDVTGVRVFMDDEPIAERLDGHELAVDPGAHRIRLEDDAGVTLSSRPIIAHAAEKNRVIQFEIALPASHDEPPTESRHTAGPWIIVSFGAAALIAGGVMLALGQSDIATSRDKCILNTDGSYSCTPSLTTPDGRDRASLNSSGTTLDTASIFAFAGGGVAIAAGLLWHFLERPRARSVAIAPLVGPSLAGLTLDARF